MISPAAYWGFSLPGTNRISCDEDLPLFSVGTQKSETIPGAAQEAAQVVPQTCKKMKDQNIQLTYTFELYILILYSSTV